MTIPQKFKTKIYWLRAMGYLVLFFVFRTTLDLLFNEDQEPVFTFTDIMSRLAWGGALALFISYNKNYGALSRQEKEEARTRNFKYYVGFFLFAFLVCMLFATVILGLGWVLMNVFSAAGTNWLSSYLKALAGMAILCFLLTSFNFILDRVGSSP